MKKYSDLLPVSLAAWLLLGSCSEVSERDPAETAAMPAPSIPYVPTAEETAMLESLAALQAQQAYQDGIALAESYLAENPQARRFHYALGILHGAANDHQRALAEFARELELDPYHVDSYRGLAAAQTILGDAPAAVASLEQALAIDAQDDEVKLELGRQLTNLGRFEEAEALLLAAADGGAATAYTELGTLYRRQGRTEEAADAFRRALRLDPNELAAMVNLGQVLIAQGKAEEGQALLKKHSERATLKDQLDLFQRSSLLEGVTETNFLRLAELQIRMGKSSEAVRSYSRALELNGRETTATLGLAAIFLKDGQPEEATKWAIHTLMIDPQSSKAHFLLGVLRLSKGQPEAAQRAFTESRKHRPWDAGTYRRAADAFLSSGHLEPAGDGYRRSLKLDPKRAASHYGRALVEYLSGRPGAALPAVERSLELAPEEANSHLLLGIIRFDGGQLAEADRAFQAALALHRIELQAGRTIDGLLAALAVHPRTAVALARYRQLL